MINTGNLYKPLIFRQLRVSEGQQTKVCLQAYVCHKHTHTHTLTYVYIGVCVK